jgi:hypothetical protein
MDLPVWFTPNIRVAHYQGGSFGGRYRFRERDGALQQSIMANYRITVWKHAQSPGHIVGWIGGECGYFAMSIRFHGLTGLYRYAMSWVVAVRRAREIRSRRGRLRSASLPIANGGEHRG